VPGRDRLRARRRRRQAAAQPTAFPLTRENLTALLAATEESARATGEAAMRDSVRGVVRVWWAERAAEGSPLADDEGVRALLDELDPGWRAACLR